MVRTTAPDGGSSMCIICSRNTGRSWGREELLAEEQRELVSRD